MSAWKFTDSTNRVVSRTLSDGRMESCIVEVIADWIAAGNTPEPADVPSAAEVAALAAKQSLDTAIAADTTLAQLKAMTNTEFDAWWLANVTTAAQAIQVLKRLAKLAIRRLA